MVSYTRYLPSQRDVYNHLCVHHASHLSTKDCSTFSKCLPYGKRVTEYQIFCAIYHLPNVPGSLEKRIEQVAHTIWNLSTHEEQHKAPNRTSGREEAPQSYMGGTTSHDTDTYSSKSKSNLSSSVMSLTNDEIVSIGAPLYSTDSSSRPKAPKLEFSVSSSQEEMALITQKTRELSMRIKRTNN